MTTTTTTTMMMMMATMTTTTTRTTTMMMMTMITYEVFAKVYKPTTLSCGKSSVVLSIYSLL
jgi:hypothetical protein